MKETAILRFSSLHRPRNRHQTLGRVVVESPPRFLIKQLSLSFINHRENGPRLSFTRWRNVAPSSCPESRVVLPAGEISPLCINMEGNCAVFLPRPAPTNTANAPHLLSLLNFPPSILAGAGYRAENTTWQMKANSGASAGRGHVCGPV